MKFVQATAALFLLVLLCFSVLADDNAIEASRGANIAARLADMNIPSELIVVIIAALPIVELRGAIPVAHMLSIHPLAAYILAVIGNMIPVVPLLLFLGPASSFCMRFKIGKAFFEWFFARTRRKSEAIEKYETLGLSIFVAIPLPITGAWTGCGAAFLMGIRFWHAFWAVLLGVGVSGAIVTALSMLGWIGAAIAAVVLLFLLLMTILRIFKKEELSS